MPWVLLVATIGGGIGSAYCAYTGNEIGAICCAIFAFIAVTLNCYPLSDDPIEWGAGFSASDSFWDSFLDE